jgi:hypothetical protein
MPDKKVVNLFGNDDSLDNAVNGAFGSVDSVNLLSLAYERTVQTSVTGILAIILWLAFLFAGYWHASTIEYLSKQYILEVSNSALDSEEIESRRWQNYERATALINDTAKTLYAVLTPLATAATGFYFSSKSKGNLDNSYSE